jgi:peptidyl-prolyl cis-trans isomerase C
MVNKLNMIAAAQAEAVEPTDEEIKAYFTLRQERYRIPATASFMHIYFNMDKRGERAWSDAREVLETIRQQEPHPEKFSDWGDQSMLQNVLVDQTEQEINRMFGAGFGTTVVSLEPGEWQGPLESGYGLHLVKVYNRVESRVPDWSEVGKQIHADMLYEARKAAEDQFYQEIAGRYRVVYDQAISELLEGERD